MSAWLGFTVAGLVLSVGSQLLRNTDHRLLAGILGLALCAVGAFGVLVID